MNGFERRKEQSKEDIRRAAWELFSQFGVDKVSIADIARKAGVSQATIYNNFGNKEALVRGFVTGAVEHLVSSAQEILTPKMSFQEKMAAVIRFISEMMASGQPSAAERVIFSSLDLQNDPEIKKIRTAAQEKMTGLMLGLIQEGKEQGQVNPKLSEAVLRIYFAVFMDAFSSSQLQQQFYQNPSLVQELGSLMMHGLSRQQG
ncbi:MAG TPA: TetR/AcrR family transcriptional regulator [Anaerolineales bacterium]|nr:TetR/AcrR family transcriptional regulator [Anaerolineales bacterium]